MGSSSSVRAVVIDITATTAQAHTAMDGLAGKATTTAGHVETAFGKATTKIGGSFRQLDNQLATFGVPFTGALSAVGKKLEETSQQSKGFVGTLSAIGGAEVLAAAAGLAVVGGAAIKMASDFETAHAQLKTAAANVGQSIDQFGGQISGADKRLEKLGFTNAETEASMARLTAATRDVGTASNLMGLAADIARARNLSLKDATDILTKVEQGRYLAITRLGIVSKQAASEFNSQAEAVAYLTALYKGQAAAAAETFGGKLKTLAATITDAGVAIGEQLIPKVEAVVGATTHVVNAFEDVNEASSGVLGKTVLIGATIPVAVFAFEKLKDAAGAVGGQYRKVTDALHLTQRAAEDGVGANQKLADSNAEVVATTDATTGSIVARGAAATATADEELGSNAELIASYAAMDEAQLATAAATGDVSAEQLAGALAAKELAAAETEVGVAYASGDVSRVVAALAALDVAQEKASVSAELLATAEKDAALSEGAAGLAGGEGAGILASLGVSAGAATAGVAVLGVALVGLAVWASSGQSEMDKLDTNLKKLVPDLLGVGKAADDARQKISALVGPELTKDLAQYADQLIAGASAHDLHKTKAQADKDAVRAVAEEHFGYAKASQMSDAAIQRAIARREDLQASARGERHAVDDSIEALKKLTTQYGAAGAQNLVLQEAQKNYQNLLAAGSTDEHALATAKQAVIDAAKNQKKVQDEAAKAVEDLGSAQSRQSAHAKDLQESLDPLNGSIGEVKGNTDAYKQATVDATIVQTQFNAISREAQAAADIQAGAVISLADAYEILHQSQNQENVQSFDNLAKAAFSTSDAGIAAAKAQRDYNTAVEDGKSAQTDAANAGKSAIAIEIEHASKVLAVRDAQEALAQQSFNVEQAQEAVAKAQFDAKKAAQDVTDAEQNLTNVLHGYAAASEEAFNATDKLAHAQLDVKSAHLDVQDAQKGLSEARQKGDPEAIQRAEIQLAEAQLRVQESQHSLKKQTEDTNGVLHGYAAGTKQATDAQDKLTTALQAEHSAQDQSRSAQFNLNKVIEDGQKKSLDLKRAQADLAGQLESNKKAAHDYAAAMEAVATAAENAAIKQAEFAGLGGASKQDQLKLAIQFLTTAAKQNPGAAGPLLEDIKNLQDELAAINAAGGPGYSGDAFQSTLPSGTTPHTSSGYFKRTHRAEGGWIPGSPGTPFPIVAHGGEYVVSVDELRGNPRGDSPFHALFRPDSRSDAKASGALGTTPTHTTAGFSAAGGSLIDGFAIGVGDHWKKNLVPFLSKARDGVTDHFKGSDKWLTDHGQKMMDGLHDGVKTGWQPVNFFFSGLPAALAGHASDAVKATGSQWKNIEFALAFPVNWSIDNVLNKAVDDVNAVAKAVGMPTLLGHLNNVPLRGFATGGIVPHTGPALVHAGEGVLPAAAMQHLSPEAFNALKSGDRATALYLNVLAGLHNFPKGAQHALAALAGKPASGVVNYLNALQPPPVATGGGGGGGRGGGGGTTPITGPLPTGGDPRVPGHTIAQWASALLAAMGIPVSDIDVRTLITWAAHESGGYRPGNIAGLYNPLNTTEAHFGKAGQGGAQGNIAGYASFEQGIANQAWNLTHGHSFGYDAILKGLRDNNPRETFDAIDRSAFGTHNLATGGVVNFPKSGAAAVLHGREAVIPLPSGFDVNSLRGGQTTIYLTVQSFDPFKAGELTVTALKDWARRNGPVPIRIASGS